MKLLKAALHSSLIPLLLGASLCLADTSIIVHPSNNAALNQEAVKKLFLGKMKSFPGGGTAVPVNKKEGEASRSEFDKNILGKSSSQIKAYWSKLVFTGKGTPPRETDTDAETKELVANNPNIIGYIDSSEVDDSVKVVLTF